MNEAMFCLNIGNEIIKEFLLQWNIIEEDITFFMEQLDMDFEGLGINIQPNRRRNETTNT